MSRKVRIVLASTSPLKIEAVEKCLKERLKDNFELIPIAVTCDNPPQPVNSTFTCALNRIEATRQEKMVANVDIIVSIENGIELDPTNCCDVCVVLCYLPGDRSMYAGTSFPLSVPRKYYTQVKERSESEGWKNSRGLKYTVGEVIHSEFEEIPSNNWMSDPRFAGVDRKIQITNALNRCLNKFIHKF